MDKVRAFLKVLWQQRFWVLSTVGALIAVVFWYRASSYLQEDFSTKKSQIDGKFSDMTSITNASIHGNDRVNEANIREASKIKDKVFELWTQLYEEQRKTVLYWPKVLEDEFLEYVEDKKFRDPITDPVMRNVYWNYIKSRFDGLVEIVQAKKMEENEYGSASFSSGLTMPREMMQPGMMPLADEKYIVEWLDQGLLRQKLDFAALPSSLEIWITQEDLWVYETLLNCIAETNKAKNATRPDNAAIRGIQSLQVGREAASASTTPGNILLPPAAADAGAATPYQSEMPPPEMPTEEGAGESSEAVLLSMRYLGEDGQPATDGSTGIGVEYRRLPVRMVLLMDQRWVPKVLIECANAALPIEVTRLRINPEESAKDFDASLMGGGGSGAAGALMGGYGGRMEMGRGAMEMGRGGGMEMGRGMMGGYQAGSMDLSNVTNPDLAFVEIQGVVYIYNRPDPSVLTVPGGEDQSAPDASVAQAGGGPTL